ncbi:unnamed protein product [Allacma fusca]|uniref:Tetraspanin n=1 Tax=Allacma fusca TaxID=39272 RepID=A0A8J2PMN8_9HEXA|nr:unnamed protein product [Allacma fusca]
MSCLPKLCKKRRDSDPDSHQHDSSQESKGERRWRLAGITVQIVLFISNGAVWIIAIMAIVGGFIVGLNTKTISIRIELFDLLVTTPATIFITYGLIIVLASILGCFTATGGNKWITCAFIIAGVLVLVFDVTFGIRIFFSTRSLLEYMRGLRGSMEDYVNKDAEPVGIFRLHPMIHWNHLQLKGQCCGMDYFDDWRNTSYGRDLKSIPDTCCNRDYQYRSCGNYFFRHPDTEHHEAQDIIYTRGCIQIFPGPLVNSFEDTVYVGILVGAIIIFCILLAVVLLVMVLLKKYTPGGGPEEWHYARTRPRESRRRSSDDHPNNRKHDRGSRRVGPAGGDQKRNSLNDTDREQERRVSFKGTSQFIPAKRTSDTGSSRDRSPEKRRNSD